MMRIEEIEDLYLAYTEGELSAEKKAEVEGLLESDPMVREVFEEMKTLDEQMTEAPLEMPPMRIKESFEAVLAEEQRSASSAKSIRFPVWAVAAGVSLLAGLTLGWLLHSQLDNGQSNEYQALLEQMEEMKQVVMLTQMQQQSASQRLAAVQASYKINQPNEEVVKSLLITLRSDPSDNVRLAAIQALAHLAPQNPVGPGMAASLTEQQNPMVQMMLIEMLVQMQEKSAVDEFTKVANDERVNSQIRARAQQGIGELL
ncbi:MAG: HEAT repeat domain-containing protein [Bacteroidota bacterium]